MRRSACRGMKRGPFPPRAPVREGKKNSGDRRGIAGHPSKLCRNRRQGAGERLFRGDSVVATRPSVNPRARRDHCHRTSQSEARFDVAGAGSRPTPRLSGFLMAGTDDTAIPSCLWVGSLCSRNFLRRPNRTFSISLYPAIGRGRATTGHETSPSMETIKTSGRHSRREINPLLINACNAAAALRRCFSTKRSTELINKTTKLPYFKSK